MADEWEDVSKLDYYYDIQDKIPGIGITSGYRTPEYVEDMRRRGYKPASKGGHLDGSKLDFTPPPGKSMGWLKARIQQLYPEAKINPNEHDHADVHFPGYTKAPAVGNAVAFGVSNPNRTPEDDWEDVSDSDTVEAPQETAAPVVNSDDPLAAAVGEYSQMGQQGEETGPIDLPGNPLSGRSAAGSNLGPENVPGGSWGERVWTALQTGVLPPEYARMPLGDSVEALLRIMAAGNEAIRGTPLEGAALASPLGGLEIGGPAALGRISKGAGVGRTLSREEDLAKEFPDDLIGTVTDEAPAPIVEDVEAPVGYRLPEPEVEPAQVLAEEVAAVKDPEAPSPSATQEELTEYSRKLNEEGNGGGEPPNDPPSDGGGGLPPEGPPEGDVVTRLTNALNEAGRLTSKQKAEYRAERSNRLQALRNTQEATTGEEGFYQELSALKGELPKVEFEGVRDQFTQPEIDDIFNQVKDNPDLSLYGKVNAREGLRRLLDGELPRPSELEELRKVFPADFVKAALKNRSILHKAAGALSDTWNLPRAMMAGYDLSGMGRQGIFMIGRPEWFRAFKKQFEALPSQKAYEGTMENVRQLPHYDKMEEAGLAITDPESYQLAHKEEDFMSRYTKYVPGLKASERAYHAGLNNLRANSFNNIVTKWDRLNLPYGQKDLSELATYVNNATGRGDLGRAEKAATVLNQVFFSPRLMASRIHMLTTPVKPSTWMTMSPLVRKEYFRDLMAFGGVATTALALAKGAGFDVEDDPRSTDFGKIKDGNARYDILGGFQQYMRLGAQLVTNQKKTMKGEVLDLGKGYGVPDAYDQTMDFARSKLHPTLGYLINARTGKNVAGQDFEWDKDTLDLFTSLTLQGLYDAYKDEGLEGAAKASPSIFGVGVQTYGQPTKDEAPKKNTQWEDVSTSSDLSNWEEVK